MDSVTCYYSKMKDSWDELDVMVPLLHCGYDESRLYVKYLRSQRILQFLMGLNGSYSQIRSHILSKGPIIRMRLMLLLLKRRAYVL